MAIVCYSFALVDFRTINNNRYTFEAFARSEVAVMLTMITVYQSDQSVFV